MHDLNDLYTRYLNKECSPEEVRMLLAHFHLTEAETLLRPRILAELAKSAIVDEDAPEVDAALKRIYHRLKNNIAADRPARTKIRWAYRIAAAAAVLVFMTAGIWFFTTFKAPPSPAVMSGAIDAVPGSNKAILVMENGGTVDLSEAQEGIIIGNRITYTDGTPVAGSANESVSQLVLITPKGGTYRVTLSDGTKVWLNSASTLKYPSQFAASERIVNLEGEAYFEVSKGVPFKVLSHGQTVEVLGTQFNVSAYPEEQRVQTTLVEGAVQVAIENQSQPMRLQPGEQSTLINSRLKKSRADIASVIAWKEGLFHFNETELRAVMHQLSRWYNVSVEYQGSIPITYYYGVISRMEPLSNVLDLLRQSGLNFKIDKQENGYKLIVFP